MATIIADISSYQDSSKQYLNSLKKYGVKGVIVKLTDGTNYLNPKAGLQVENSFKVGMDSVGLYHFYQGDPVNEARYFLKWVKAFGMDHTTPLAIDVESTYLPMYNTDGINTFLNEVKKAGYRCRVVYSSSSWLNIGRVNYRRLNDKNIWVAAYGTDRPGVDNADAWQYTDNFKGLATDASYDFSGVLTGRKFDKITNKPVDHKEKPKQEVNYISSGNTFMVTTDALNVYNSPVFEAKNHTHYKYTKGTTFPGKPVKFGNVYRIKLSDGTYTSANSKFIKKV